jgi:recA bacterial DNA recombination protein
MDSALFRAQIEKKLPSAFMTYTRGVGDRIPTGISAIDSVVQGIPLRAITEICGSSIACSGKTSVLASFLAKVSRDRFCVLVDASDSFNPETGYAAGINFSRLLWVRCGKSKVELRPLEQAFKVTDILLQSSGFGVIAVDLSGISERVLRKVPLSTWFRFSRVIEKQSAALVFIAQEPHATSCAGLVLRAQSEPTGLSGKLFTGFDLKIEVVRDATARKPAHSAGSGFILKTQWA